MRRVRITKITSKTFKKEKYGIKPSSSNSWYEARDKRLKLDNYQCQEKDCGSKIHVEVHHKIPISHGGSHSISNLITLCRKHHDKQHKHKMKNFLKTKGK